VKGKSKVFKLAVALALVVGLVPVIAAPASALAAASFTLVPNTAGSATQVSVNVTLGTTLASPSDTLTVTFPSGFTVPATISRSFVSIAGYTLLSDPVIAGQVVTMQLPDTDDTTPGYQGPLGTAGWTAAGSPYTLVISQLAGIKNPSVGVYRYRLSFVTSQEATSVNSNYVVVIRTASRSPSSGVRGTSTTVTGVGFAAATTVNIVRGRSGANDVLDNVGPDMTLTELAAGNDFTAAPTAVVVGNIVRNISDGSSMIVTAVAATTLTGANGLTGGNTNTWSVGDLYAVELTGPALGSGTVASDGTFSVAFSANVPPFGPGSNTFVATDGSGRSATSSFTINPSATLSPTSGRPGATIAVTARDYAGANIATTTVAGTTVVMNPVAPGITGGAANFSINVPALLAGAQSVIITDNAGNSATTTLTIAGSPLTPSPSTGVIGTRVTVSGSGFTANGNIAAGALMFGGVAWNPAVITIDSGGNFLVALTLTGAGLAGIDATASTAGTYAISALDSGGLSGAVNFTVPVAAITLDKASSVVGSSVIVRGTGFPANSVAIVTYSINGVPSPVGTGIVDSTGNFAAAISVPTTAVIPSTNVIAATATTTNGIAVPPGATPAQATHSVPSAAITLSASSGNPGSIVKVTGTGFPAYAVVAALTVGGLPAMPSPAPATDGAGNVVANVLVPSLPAGPAVLAITVGGVTGSVAFTITTSAATPGQALAGIAGMYSRVWGYDSSAKVYKLFDPAVPLISDLTVLSRGQGYWINCTQATTLVYGANQYVLVVGWNLIGWLD